MRYPSIINENTRIAYIPGDAALNLEAETNRKVKAEDFEWDNDLCPLLTDLCIEVIAKNFHKEQILHELPCADKYHLLDIIPTDLALDIVVPLIEEENYWKRRYTDHFGNAKETKPQSCTWKCIYLERHIQKFIEQAEPQYSDEETAEDLLKLINPYIHKLKITELQAWRPPLTWEKDEIPTIYPTDHIDFAPIFSKLEFVEELDLSFGMKNVDTEFTWNLFKISVADCRRLGKSVLFLKLMKIFRLHRSAVDDEKIRALSQGLIKHKMLVELDLSHCLIGDQGALCIAKLMLSQQTLRIINLADNQITMTGAEGIGFALLENGCCPLIHLNLRLNPLRHDGVMGIFRALVRGDKPEEINLAACQFEEETSLRLSQVIKLNSTLKWLDVSCNWFDLGGSKEIYNGMVTNKTLLWFDLRETDIPHDILENINKLILRNKLGIEDLVEDLDFSEMSHESDLIEVKPSSSDPTGRDPKVHTKDDSSDED